MPIISNITREGWLEAAVEKIKPLFRSCEIHEFPMLKVSVGWPSRGALSRKKLTIGQCWDATESADDSTFNIFISPLLDKPADPTGVLATLVHEIIHAVIGTKAAHGREFIKLARLIGLEGKPTSTHASEALVGQLEEIAAELGDFPHSRIDPTVAAKKPQSTRLVKCSCAECGYTIRITQKWINYGIPACPGTSHGTLKVILKGAADPEEGAGE